MPASLLTWFLYEWEERACTTVGGFLMVGSVVQATSCCTVRYHPPKNEFCAQGSSAVSILSTKHLSTTHRWRLFMRDSPPPTSPQKLPLTIMFSYTLRHPKFTPGTCKVWASFNFHRILPVQTCSWGLGLRSCSDKGKGLRSTTPVFELIFNDWAFPALKECFDWEHFPSPEERRQGIAGALAYL